MLPKLKARTAPKFERSVLPPPKTVEEIPAYIERARTESEKRLASYLAQVKEVCDAVKPGEMPDIPQFLRRRLEVRRWRTTT
jgi:hypothetical protein